MKFKQTRVVSIQVIPLNTLSLKWSFDSTSRSDHATRMAKFARECLTKVSDLVRKLETTLGPDTGELSMRFGLNSGPGKLSRHWSYHVDVHLRVASSVRP